MAYPTHHPFRFGVLAAYAPSHAAWVSQATQAEDLGYSSLLIPDRTSMGILAPIPALAVAASATTTLRVGSYVFCNSYRHPVLLAREAATLDLLSGGRFELGLGAGVSATESEQMGIPFAGAGARVQMVEESVQLIKRLFTEETVNFTGQHYTVTNLKGNLQPVQKPHPPILVAGTGEKMLKMAAREADCIAVGHRMSGPATAPTDATLEQKIAWIKSAAGDRFPQLVLCQTIYDFEITDSPSPLAAQQGGWNLPKRPFSTEQAAEYLAEQRDRFGFSYLQVQASQMHNFAPVVARLAGK
jgi:probable F420-dependent oxidoreductase